MTVAIHGITDPAFADPEARVGFAFVTSHMLGFDDGNDPRRERLISALYDAL